MKLKNKYNFILCANLLMGCAGKDTDISNYNVTNISNYEIKIFQKYDGGIYGATTREVALPGETVTFRRASGEPGTFNESPAHRPIQPFEVIGGICIEFFRDNKPMGRSHNFMSNHPVYTSSTDSAGVNQHIFTYTVSDASLTVAPYNSCYLND